MITAIAMTQMTAKGTTIAMIVLVLEDSSSEEASDKPLSVAVAVS